MLKEGVEVIRLGEMCARNVWRECVEGMYARGRCVVRVTEWDKGNGKRSALL
jgi:hypothetical protein